jgi:hypothetical protein
MQEIEIVVDFNGIVIFDPECLCSFYPGLEKGANLYRCFTQTVDGDEVVKQGIVVPIIGINDSIYKVIVRGDEGQSKVDPELILVSSGCFPLRISKCAVIADLAVFLERDPDESWQVLNVPAGNYSVKVNGFRKVENNEITDFGFELVLTCCAKLPELTGSLKENMQVLELPMSRWVEHDES